MDYRELLVKYLLYKVNTCDCEDCQKIYHVDILFTPEEKAEVTKLNNEAYARFRKEYDNRPQFKGMTTEEITADARNKVLRGSSHLN